MSRPTVELGATSSRADYYRVSGKTLATVRHGTATHPFACLTHNSNDCEHINAVKDFIAAQQTENPNG
jgi:hypothetical protein